MIPWNKIEHASPLTGLCIEDIRNKLDNIKLLTRLLTMNDDEKKLPERILKGILEVLSLLTGEVTLVQHLSNSLTVKEMNRDKKIFDRIMNLIQEIMRLMTREEYTSVKKNLPHSSIQHLTREGEDSAVSLSMEVWEYPEGQMEMCVNRRALKSLGSVSPESTGSHDENVGTILIGEGGKYTREKKDIKQEETETDLCADTSNTNDVIEEFQNKVHTPTEDTNSVSQLAPRDFPLQQKGDSPSASYQYKDKAHPSHEKFNKNLNNKASGTRVIDKKSTTVCTKSASSMLDCKKEQTEEVVSSKSKQFIIESKIVDANHESQPKKKQYDCPDCGKVFIVKSKLVEHHRIHTGEKPYVCPDCQMAFTKRSHLVRHSKTHTGEKPYVCQTCGKGFSERANLIKHNIIHTGEKPYVCQTCGRGFSERSTLVRHNRMHTGEKPYVCQECGTAFSNRSSLVKHQIIHTNEKPYVCDKCGKCFTQNASLIKHNKTHSGEKPYTCSDCGKSFFEKSNLVTHYRTHTGEKPYVCQECGKGFANKSNLAAHQIIHTNKKPYVCETCGKCFTQNASLFKHNKIHRGERPHACNECGKSFFEKSNLVTHYRIHTGEKLHICQECGKAFANKSNLIVHCRAHTREKT
ncbi:zinc finger protein ZFP2 isoform X2 [Bombina bombina]|uniref:zinc finger protein ZFP2 isoform X2 n=1 Tax=Bombina bombina TaxID=8345 RepID=UPI00235ACC2B|nr:zinc finger protein ZFP2 isoform X2 [Bombina bombina]